MLYILGRDKEFSELKIPVRDSKTGRIIKEIPLETELKLRGEYDLKLDEEIIRYITKMGEEAISMTTPAERKGASNCEKINTSNENAIEDEQK